MDQQIVLFSIMGGVFALLIYGRWRYDLVAFSALVIALLLGAVPKEEAFSGFGHPATVIIALVLIVSRGLSASGAVEIITRTFIDASRKLSAHIGIMAALSAALSAVMNNVAALALLMPVDIQAARKAKRSPALTLMPLSFASILGGLITLIGTPPNIIVAEFRGTLEDRGQFSMFDFAPVGIACAVVGVIFVALIGWRLIPVAATSHDTPLELEDLEGYIAEAVVTDKSPIIDQQVRDLDKISEENDVAIVGLIRRGKRLAGFGRRETIRKGDVLVLEAGPDAMEAVRRRAGKLEYARRRQKLSGVLEPAPWRSCRSCGARPAARIENRSAHLAAPALSPRRFTLLGGFAQRQAVPRYGYVILRSRPATSCC